MFKEFDRTNIGVLASCVEKIGPTFLAVRPHHLIELAGIYYRYYLMCRDAGIERGINISMVRFFDSEIDKFTEDEALVSVDFYRKYANMSPWFERAWNQWYAEDVGGVSGSIKERVHVKAVSLWTKEWLTRSSNTDVIISLFPDDLCATCVGGLHCFKLGPKKPPGTDLSFLENSFQDEQSAISLSSDIWIMKYLKDYFGKNHIQYTTLDESLILAKLNNVRDYINKVVLSEYGYLKASGVTIQHLAKIFPVQPTRYNFKSETANF